MISDNLSYQLLELYEKILPSILLGTLAGFYLSNQWISHLGKFLFYIGIPITIASFLRRADLSESVWIASIIAVIAVILGGLLSWLWLKNNQKYNNKSFTKSNQSIKAIKGSFLLSSMAGNTRYFGFPIVLVLIGQSNFGWAIFYDLMSSMIGAYGLGMIIAAYCGTKIESYWSFSLTILKNPALWGVILGLFLREIPLNQSLETSLSNFGWIVLSLSLALIGMRLAKFSFSWKYIKLASISLTIKMFLVPLLLGIGLSLLEINSSVRLLIVLLAAMPPAISTLIIAESYNLEKQLTTTTIIIGSILLPFTLLFWTQLFPV